MSLSFSLHAQIGGQHGFEFLLLSPSARITAMGGTFGSVMDDDPALAYQNPSLLNPLMNNCLTLNRIDYITDINYGYAGYAKTFDHLKTTFNGGIQFMNYGKFTETDPIGATIGEFKASEYAFNIGAGREYTDRFYYGISATFISSKLESYYANGLAFTLAGAYNDTANDFTATVLFKNVGQQFKSYTGSLEPLPFDIQAAVSKRFEHTPFLFSLTLHHLQQFNIRYDNPAEVQATTVLIDSTQDTTAKKYIADKIFRHAIIGTEIYFGKAVRINIAYNHLRRQELGFSTHKGLAGFSFGAGINVYRFSINYGRAIYDTAGGVNHISIGVNLDDWFRKKKM